MVNLTTEERFKRAKIKLQSRNPFFSYLSLFLDIKEDTKGIIPETSLGMGVSITGELFYKKKFVDSLSDEELIGVLCHEILHLTFLHLLRCGNRNKDCFNIACDIVTNHILQQNNFNLPNGGIMPKYDYHSNSGTKGYCIKLGLDKKGKQVIIKNIEGKSAEQIYDELPRALKQKSPIGYYVVVDENGKESKGFDKHLEGKGLTKQQKEELKEEWESKVSEAYISAKQRGELPSGLERLIGKLHKEQVDWRTLLKKYITNEIPNDYSWARRSKKSIACGFYMPSIVKEKVKIAIAIDTSGSIGTTELTQFLSEIIGMARAYRDKIDMVLYSHDVEVSERYEVRGGSIPKIMKMKLKGGGGTSHKEVIEKLNDEVRDCKAVVFFTDGYSDIDEIDFNKYKFKSIFVIDKNGTDEQLKDKDVIKIKIV